MNITFFVGNGFDVGVGMNSRFKDFFPIYQSQSINKRKRIKQLSDEISNDYETWADFEIAMGKYTDKFNQNNKQNFIDQMKDFENEFIHYLKLEENNLSFENTKYIASTIQNALTTFYSDKNLHKVSSNTLKSLFNTYSSDNHVYNFVNFNYTNILECCLQTLSDNIVQKRNSPKTHPVKIDKIGETIHVHGSNQSYPIIGVNDSSQVKNPELANDKTFLRYIVKPSINNAIRMDYDEEATSLISKSLIICIYGMSLGETDKIWWTRIIDWLKGNTSRQLIIFDYDDKFTASTPYDWLEKEDKIINKFIQFSGRNYNEIEVLRPRIHIAVHKNIFQMNLRKKEYNNNIAMKKAIEEAKYVANHIDEYRELISQANTYRDELAKATGS